MGPIFTLFFLSLSQMFIGIYFATPINLLHINYKNTSVFLLPVCMIQIMIRNPLLYLAHIIDSVHYLRTLFWLSQLTILPVVAIREGDMDSTLENSFRDISCHRESTALQKCIKNCKPQEISQWSKTSSFVTMKFERLRRNEDIMSIMFWECDVIFDETRIELAPRD